MTLDRMKRLCRSLTLNVGMTATWAVSGEGGAWISIEPPITDEGYEVICKYLDDYKFEPLEWIAEHGVFRIRIREKKK